MGFVILIVLKKYVPLLPYIIFDLHFLVPLEQTGASSVSFITIPLSNPMDVFEACLDPQQQNLSNNYSIDEDIFSSSINLEECHINDGYKDGYEDGLALGKQEGSEVGLKHGFESGEELGFYRGLIDVWTSVVRIEPSFFSARIQKSIHQIDELLEKYPYTDHEDESKDDILKELRLKFKAIGATLGVKLEYNGTVLSLKENKVSMNNPYLEAHGAVQFARFDAYRERFRFCKSMDSYRRSLMYGNRL
ncbi:hypothetical protein BVRB_8g191890 [Beta vulgaris subsp. vulgaris]|nr:hypothetical protein BVRB_8g191890 [Beta vulgaris subsp. vulgaris]